MLRLIIIIYTTILAISTSYAKTSSNFNANIKIITPVEMQNPSDQKETIDSKKNISINIDKAIDSSGEIFYITSIE